MEKKLIKILADVNEDILNYNGDNMLADGIIDSFTMVEIISEIEDEFDIEFDVEEVVSENFATKDIIMSFVASKLKN